MNKPKNKFRFEFAVNLFTSHWILILFGQISFFNVSDLILVQAD